MRAAAVLAIVAIAWVRAPAARADEDARTRVRFDAGDPSVTLFRIQLVGSALVTDADGNAVAVPQQITSEVCHSPCDAQVDPSSSYEIAGTNVVASEPFTLAAGRANRLDVRTGSAREHRAGFLLMIGGIAPISVGLALIIDAVVEGVPAMADQTVRSAIGDRQSSYYTAGGVVLGVGVAALATGVVLLAVSRTKVIVDGGRPALRIGRVELRPDGIAF